jgi:hypothetical protein
VIIPGAQFFYSSGAMDQFSFDGTTGTFRDKTDIKGLAQGGGTTTGIKASFKGSFTADGPGTVTCKGRTKTADGSFKMKATKSGTFVFEDGDTCSQLTRPARLAP